MSHMYGKLNKRLKTRIIYSALKNILADLICIKNMNLKQDLKNKVEHVFFYIFAWIVIVTKQLIHL